eukprot:8711-Rhodomonas_salina.1
MVRTDYQEGHQAGEGYSLSRERHELRDRVSMLKRQSKGQELQGQRERERGQHAQAPVQGPGAAGPGEPEREGGRERARESGRERMGSGGRTPR